jgi:xanthine dehydrogenase YagR molybdenum-binding subunit
MGIFDRTANAGTMADGRVEGIFKVTGKGKYAAEYKVDNCCYGVVVSSTVASGRIRSLLLDDAKQVAGVIDIISHIHKPEIAIMADEAKAKEARVGLPVFHTDKIFFKGQPIAVVIGETLEDATYAASLVSADYETAPSNVDFESSYKNAALTANGKDRGSTDAWSGAPVTIDAEYTIKNEVHNPMEMHATTAHWYAENKLRLYDKTQGVNNVQRFFARLFNIPQESIEVISEFVGGGFGSGLRVWPNAIMAALAAKQVNRPVKLMLTRPQMFSMAGYRPQSWQRIKIGADNDGKFLGILHQARNTTSLYENFAEGITRITRLVYRFDNLKAEAATVPLNLSTPAPMRGPGDCTGDFAVESAIDELSYKLKQDPVELRLKNISLDKHPDNGLPWSTHFIDECIRRGAATVGWNKRQPNPGQLKEGDWQIGYGMAVGMWNAGRNNAGAAIELKKDGTVIVQTAMTDIGTGTGTAMQNITHDQLGIPKSRIKIELGNSTLPAAPSQGGSTGLSSIGGAMVAVCDAFKKKVIELAANVSASFKEMKPGDLVFNDAGISSKSSTASASYAELLDKNNLQTLEVEASSGPGQERQKFAFCSSAAHFCIVRVHSKTGKVKVDRMVSVADGGKIINEKAAANQLSGAAIGGIGMTLMEEQQVDKKLGITIGDDLAGYHFAVNADAPLIEVSFINKPDLNINPVGSKGLGEVGIIGCAAAITNAIYNATGKRLRDLPVTPDKVLMSV